MRPFTLSERGATPTISIAGLLAGHREPSASFGSPGQPALNGVSTYDLIHYVDEIVRSGFPGIRNGTERARRALLDGYLTRIVEREFLEMGHVIRNPAALRRWMVAYAGACSSTASFEAIRDAATSGRGEKPSRDSAGPYRDVLERLHVLDPVSAWAPRRGQLPRIGVAPKHQLADPALAASLLGLTPDTLLESGRGLGALFESLVTLGVQVYAQAAGARVGHLRTHRGEHEVDLIVERPDGRIIAIEVKLSATVSDGDVRHLHWLHRQVGDDLLDAIVVTTGREAYRRTDGVGVVPAALLGP